MNYLETKLTSADLAWMYFATSEAFGLVKNIRRKTNEEIDGEIFTSLRRMSRESNASKTIRDMFTGRMKFFDNKISRYTTTKEQEALIHMYNTLKRAKLSEEPDAMAELRVALLAMQAHLHKAKSIAAQAEGVRKSMETIPQILDGEEN